MNNAPRETLRRIIAKHGTDLCGDARRCEALLKDLCGEYRRETNVLTSAIEERIPLDMLAAGNSMPRRLLFARLAKRLEDNLGLTAEASRWAVNSWAFALGFMTEAEIAEKEKNQSVALPPPQQTPPLKPSRPIPQQNNIKNNPNNPPARRPTQTPPRAQSPQKIYPPVARTPVNFPTPAPKFPPLTRSGSNVNVPQPPPQANSPIPNIAPKRRFGKFSGCLFVLFLLIISAIILVLGVPYAIEVMRDTQRQSEPTRFP